MIQAERVAAPVGAFSVATRVAGGVIAVAYLIGMVPGPLVSVVGGLALITFGRAALLSPRSSYRAVLALAVLAGALGVGALRWGTLDLGELRGVQAVLGPTLTVGPPAAAVACGIAMAGGLVVLALWFSEPVPEQRIDLVWSGLEVALVALSLVTIFFDPARSVLQGAGIGIALVEVGRWVAVTTLASAIVWGLSQILRRASDFLRWVVLGSAGAGVAIAAGIVAGTL